MLWWPKEMLHDVEKVAKSEVVNIRILEITVGISKIDKLCFIWDTEMANILWIFLWKGFQLIVHHYDLVVGN